MSIKTFIEEVRNGLGSQVYLLCAQDPYLLKEAAFSVKKTIPEHELDFLFHMFDMLPGESTASVDHIIDILNTVSLMGGRKTVVVDNSQKLSEGDLDKVAAYISSPSPDSLLILLNSGTLKKSPKEKLKKAKVLQLDIRERDLPFWVKERAADKGLRLTDRAIEYLIGTIGPDAGLLSSEIEKFSLAGTDTIDVEDISRIIKGNGDYDAFDLVDALKSKSPEKVYKIYRALSETQEPYSILGALNWHYGRTRDRLKDKENVFALLSEADLMIKSSGGAYQFEYLLAQLLKL
jgi:DNA polymerase III delta subunit